MRSVYIGDELRRISIHIYEDGDVMLDEEIRLDGRWICRNNDGIELTRDEAIALRDALTEGLK